MPDDIPVNPGGLPDNHDDEIILVVNPEDTIGVELKPAYISLGVSQEQFKIEVGGIPKTPA
jgi:hypothetical protein